VSANDGHDAVPTKRCWQCRSQLGCGRDRCWWCYQAFGDDVLARTADHFLEKGENAWAFIAPWLARMRAEHGVFFVS
jgi:hypothetical protein